MKRTVVAVSVLTALMSGCTSNIRVDLPWYDAPMHALTRTWNHWLGTAKITDAEAYRSRDEMAARYNKAEEEAVFRQNFGFKADKWNQPANKTEQCLLPMTDQLASEPNAQQYWDGACKNGFAYGFGRNIFVSDYSHIEDITFYDNANSTKERLGLYRDYVHNRTLYYEIKPEKYFKVLKEELVHKTYQTTITLPFHSDSFYSTHTSGVSKFKSSIVDNAAYSTISDYDYKAYEYYSGLKTKDKNVFFAKQFNSLNNKESNKLIKIGGIYYGSLDDEYRMISSRPFFEPLSYDLIEVPDGFKSELIRKNGRKYEFVKFPAKKAYIQEINNAFNEASDHLAPISNTVSLKEKAKELETKYLYGINREEHDVPDGIAPELYYKILNYYTDFDRKERATRLLIAKGKKTQAQELAEWIDEIRYQQGRIAVLQAKSDAAKAMADADDAEYRTVDSARWGNFAMTADMKEYIAHWPR